MSSISDNEEEKHTDLQEQAEVANPDEKKSGGSMNSLLILAIIGIAIFAGRDYLTGVKEIPVLTQVLSESASAEGDVDTGLEIPRRGDTKMKKLLSEFKVGFDKIPNTELMEAKVERIIFSEDETRLVIELEYLDQESGARAINDVIYQKDEFGRLQTDTEWLSQIKLHPND